MTLILFGQSKNIIALQPLSGLLTIYQKSALCLTNMLLQTSKNGTDEKPPCDVCVAPGRQGKEGEGGGGVAHLKHGQVAQRKVPEAGDVEEGDLIRTIGRVSASQLNWLPQVAHILALPLVPHIVLVALSDHQVSRIVGAHIQAGDDPSGQSPRSSCTSVMSIEVKSINKSGSAGCHTERLQVSGDMQSNC